MSQIFTFSKGQQNKLWIAALAAKLLPIVHGDPGNAYIEHIFNRLDLPRLGNPTEEEVESALVYLVDESILDVEEVDDPKLDDPVKMYTLTHLGAFILTHQSGSQKAPQVLLTE